MCTTRKLFMEFTFLKGGENSVDNIKIPVTHRRA